VQNTSNAFGSTQPQQGSAFGSSPSAANTFGGASGLGGGGGGFGQQQNQQQQQQQQQQSKGTGPPNPSFQAYLHAPPNTDSKAHFFHTTITANPDNNPYHFKSFEELRMEDYATGNKGVAIGQQQQQQVSTCRF